MHTIDPVGRATTASTRGRTILLLALWGTAAPVLLCGCPDSIAYPFRPLRTDAGMGGSAGTGGADAGPPPVDAGPDAPPDTPPISCPTKLVGYATLTLDGGTTGGGDAPVVVVTTLDQLQKVANTPGPGVVRISGKITVTVATPPIDVESDKTIVGDNPKMGDGLVGTGLIVKDKHNVIFRNLTITKAIQPADAITVQHSTNVWIDHCDLSSVETDKDTYDGLIDITHASDNVTVSWNRFHDHYKTTLVGHSENNAAEDTGHLTVTYHHNLFVHTQEGTPRARFGHIHVFNNHFVNVNIVGVASATSATTVVEGNVFDQVKIPIATHFEDAVDGVVSGGGPISGGVGSDPKNNNLFNPIDSVNANVLTTPFTTWMPPYAYDLSSETDVPIVVETCAGVFKVP